ncbi:MAG TPA: OmpA family protein [Myxococcota bacterium]|nr:OmpA family protein [Myxococcota bacterium]HRY95681.1 OmpA family protein [Myxococcota bacterium]HSA23160.1 OmpA family protein [Myxococcota bacterium]
MRNPVWPLACSFVLAALLAHGPARAQEDAAGAKEHALLSRLEGFYIAEQESGQGEEKFYTARNRTEAVEGQRTATEYRPRDNAPRRSPTTILQEQVEAFRLLGAQVLHQGDTVRDDLYASMKLTRAGKEIWASVLPGDEGYRLVIVERVLVKPEITADEIRSALNAEGFTAVPLKFVPGKPVLHARSHEVVAQIAAMLKTDTDLKLSIEGHTDNRGNPKALKALSENRAKTVLQALTRVGIDPKRLKAVGWGSEKPVADNRTPAGRARNERIELVRQQ